VNKYAVYCMVRANLETQLMRSAQAGVRKRLDAVGHRDNFPELRREQIQRACSYVMTARHGRFVGSLAMEAADAIGEICTDERLDLCIITQLGRLKDEVVPEMISYAVRAVADWARMLEGQPVPGPDG
jgi:hypothetical protein